MENFKRQRKNVARFATRFVSAETEAAKAIRYARPLTDDDAVDLLLNVGNMFGKEGSGARLKSGYRSA